MTTEQTSQAPDDFAFKQSGDAIVNREENTLEVPVSLVSTMSRREFQEKAIRTESIVDKIEVEEYAMDAFIDALRAYEQAGEILDKFKKHIFYKDDLDILSIVEHATEFDDLGINIRTSIHNLVANREKNKSKTVVLDEDPRVFHALLGTITEHGEIATALLYGIGTGELDLVNVCEELADSDWYKALFYEATGIEWVNVQAMIIKKLEIRYSDVIFTEEEAKERDLEAERKVLTDAIQEAVNEYKASRGT